MESIFKAPNLEITYDPVNRFIYCNWIGFQSKEMIIDSGSIIHKLFKERNITKVLNDNTLVTGPWQEAAEWTATIWFPTMIAAGLKHFAWIFSPNIFAELSAVKAMPMSSVVKPFSSYREAYVWLLEQEE
jgi:hypothetical protein